jgi:ADP-ribose pyrophosphatase
VLDNDASIKPGGWADPSDPATVQRAFASFEGEVLLDSSGRPLNPKGRMGLGGRGLLGKWGANFAADPMVFRPAEGAKGWEILLIKRLDNGQWAIPGGMVDEGEPVEKTLARELLEETGVQVDFHDSHLIYRGYVNDPRNTDHAWMETTARLLTLSAEEGAALHPKAGDDAARAEWCDANEEMLGSLYANHGELVRAALRLV